MITVLDASAAMQIVQNGERGPIFSDAIERSDAVLAPDLFVSEITNVFWKYARFTTYGLPECLSGMNAAVTLIDEFVDCKDLFVEAFFEATKYKHSAYDFFYVLIARRHGGKLLTADNKMTALAGLLGVECV